MTNDVDFPNLHTCYKTCLGHGASKRFHCTIYRLTACLIETDFVSRKKKQCVHVHRVFNKTADKKLFDRTAICLQFCVCKRLSERSFQVSPEDLSPSV